MNYKFITTGIQQAQNMPEFLIKSLKQIDENVSTATIKRFATSRKGSGIRELRSIIDQVSPALLLVDYGSVRQELEKYFTLTSQNLSRIDPKSQKVGGDRATTVEERFTFRQELIGKDKIINDILKAIKDAVTTFKSTCTPKTYEDALQEMISKAQLGIPFLEPGAKIVLIPGKQGKTFGANIDAAFLFRDFATASNTISTAISREVEKALNELSIDVIGTKKGLLNALLDLGHTVAKVPISDDQEEYYGNFPKLSQVLITKLLEKVLDTSQSLPPVEVTDLQAVAEDFLTSTYQKENFVEVEKDFSSDFLSIFVRYGGQVLKLENSSFNQYRGSSVEQKFPGASGTQAAAVFKRALEDQARKIQAETEKRIYEEVANSIIDSAKVLPGKRSSFSLTDYIIFVTKNIFDGTKPQPFNQVKQDTGTTKLKRSKVVTPVKTKPKTSKSKLKIKVSPGAAIRSSVLTQKSIVNLPMLMMQINSNLHDQIKANMGTGNRRDVLNYRTGRFAQSAKVERISESRQGMITAFYSYMKNPYATFSRGGRQDRPYSRDPKLLISKSIRELAGQQVANRMRSVLL